jgi:hypothetical protein
VSEHVLGFKNYLKEDWMSENTWKLIGDRKELKAQHGNKKPGFKLNTQLLIA